MKQEQSGEWGRTPDCPDLEALLSADGENGDHVINCPSCQTELALYREFVDPQFRAGEEAAVEKIVSGIDWRSEAPRAAKVRWWNAPSRWVWAGAAAMACAAVLLTVDLSSKRGVNRLTQLSEQGNLTRSQALLITTPLFDLEKAPEKIEWKAISGADRYQVTITEVDHREIFHQIVTTPSLLLPGPVGRLLLPGKTVLLEVIARDSVNATIGESGKQKLRVAPDGH